MQQAEQIEALFSAIDAKDEQAFGRFLSEDVTFRFGNVPPVVGRQAAVAAVEQFFASIAGLRHDLFETWTRPDSVICRGEVTYKRHNGSQVTVPFMDYFGLADDKILHYQIYIDISPLLADS